MKKLLPFLFFCCILFAACGDEEPTPTPLPPTATSAPTATPTPRIPPTPIDAGSLSVRQPFSDTTAIPLLATRQAEISQTLALTIPIMPLGGELSAEQQRAQSLAIADPTFQSELHDTQSGQPLRSEIFGIYPTRASDHVGAAASCANSTCYRVEMYNYALNLTTNAIVDVVAQSVLAVNKVPDTQPDIPPALTDLAVQIAIHSPEVAKELGVKPGAEAAMMANTKTALNSSICERSRHLCVAPTFMANDHRALWAIVDLTDGALVGTRWTDVGLIATTHLSEKTLQNDVVSQDYCDKTTALAQSGWEMDYIITSSDGVRLSNVRYKGKFVISSIKLVDWHVSYSGTEGFGYSDAIGCPVFSQAAVLAFNPPEVQTIAAEGDHPAGFVLIQDFRSELWPMPCNYNYEQRYEFYEDGSFRPMAANLGRGCGNNGTYRPVTRIVLAGKQSVATWNGTDWQPWTNEGWKLQREISTTEQGFQVQFTAEDGSRYAMSPGQSKPPYERGDDAYIYVTLNHPDRDEGESDLVTIGPCCNDDYQQGPEKFIDPAPESIEKSEIVVWYVAQIHNDAVPGEEFCWADFVLKDGVYTPKAYPCYSGPRFVPQK
ncbi:MAG: hypothetical protein U0175_30085 [Caldilineaceae bacterium]